MCFQKAYCEQNSSWPPTCFQQQRVREENTGIYLFHPSSELPLPSLLCLLFLPGQSVSAKRVHVGIKETFNHRFENKDNSGSRRLLLNNVQNHLSFCIEALSIIRPSLLEKTVKAHIFTNTYTDINEESKRDIWKELTLS